MVAIIVPPLEPDEYGIWPSLGEQVCAWAEDNLIFGPGDLHGQPYVFDDEKRALTYRAYEVYPEGHANQGRRRFRRVSVSLQKGSAKTEWAAIIAACELHPDAPVRTARFEHGRPIGRGVQDPYIPLVAYTDEQADDLAYSALKIILEESRVARDFIIGVESIQRRVGYGIAKAMASAPNSREGARTTFSHKDETHRWTLPRLKNAAKTMLANLPKRLLADPWDLETTTAFSPGEGSVAEDTFDYAKQVLAGKTQDSRIFFFHRQASDDHNIETKEGLHAAVVEAAGPQAIWKDIDGICEQFDDPKADRAFLERVWLNRHVQTSLQAFNVTNWRTLKRPDYTIKPRSLCVLGFDGSRGGDNNPDSTGLCLTEVATGHQVWIGKWFNPYPDRPWSVDEEAVNETVDLAFKTYDIWAMWMDPFYWQGWLATWAAKYRRASDKHERIVSFATNAYHKMSIALQSYKTAQENAELSHDGDSDVEQHFGNCIKQELNFVDEDGHPLWIVRKDRPHSPNKIDYVMAGCLSNEARNACIASGALKRGGAPRVTLL